MNVNISCVCHYQELLNQEKAQMEMNQRAELSTRSFNFGAYHRLETVGLLNSIWLNPDEINSQQKQLQSLTF